MGERQAGEFGHGEPTGGEAMQDHGDVGDARGDEIVLVRRRAELRRRVDLKPQLPARLFLQFRRPILQHDGQRLCRRRIDGCLEYGFGRCLAGEAEAQHGQGSEMT